MAAVQLRRRRQSHPELRPPGQSIPRQQAPSVVLQFLSGGGRFEQRGEVGDHFPAVLELLLSSYGDDVQACNLRGEGVIAEGGA